MHAEVCLDVVIPLRGQLAIALNPQQFDYYSAEPHIDGLRRRCRRCAGPNHLTHFITSSRLKTSPIDDRPGGPSPAWLHGFFSQ